MIKYNEQDLNTATNNAYKTIGHLINVLNNFDGDLGGPKDELRRWTSELRNTEAILEYIMELSED